VPHFLASDKAISHCLPLFDSLWAVHIHAMAEQDSRPSLPAVPSGGTDHAPRLTAVIVGAGMSGLLAAIRLKQEGIESFVVLERGDDVGGTWLYNQYPGASCDVPSHLYSYSFRPKPDWSRMFAMQPEILEYFRDTAKAEGLYPHIAFRTEVAGAAFDEREGRWRVAAKDGREWDARFLFIATGQLNEPAIPDIPGRRDFAGIQFHSARWNAATDLTGKNVVAIGTGASAAQYVPPVAEQAKQLTVIQRSPNWMIPRPDFEFPDWAKTAMRYAPPLRRLLRAFIYFSNELNFRAMRNPGGWIARGLERKARKQLEEEIPDRELRAKLTPDYPVGCKRLLVISDYYPALRRENVELVTDSVSRIHQTGIELESGRRIPAEVLIWGTGFDTKSFVLPIEITGLGGRRLSDDWAKGAEGYKGTLVSGYPNMAVLYGPNTNLGHSSIIFMAERQMDYVMKLVRAVLGKDLRYLDVRPEVQRRWNADLQRRLGKTVWAGPCESWYKHDGKIINNWSSTTIRFALETRTLDERNFDAGTHLLPGAEPLKLEPTA
jgi:cation diffusion facilitator CzcD-associated flavoprotein CzcO